MNLPIVIGSFVASLLFFTAVGLWSVRKHKNTAEDYLVASRSVGPWLTALSSVSTNHSGFMFIGLIGYAYTDGVQAIWLMLGWFLGDLLAWTFVHRRVREVSEKYGLKSFTGLLAGEPGKPGRRALIILCGLLTFIFLGGYAAAQLKAGSTALHSIFGWAPWVGTVMGAIIVVLYSFSGGIRASIWTDAAQSIVMLFAMVILATTCLVEVGGPAALFEQLEAINPTLIQWIPNGLMFGFGLYLLGCLAGGFGTVGQPHVMIRFIALDKVDSITRTRRIYFTWYGVFTSAALTVGLCARVLLPELTAGIADDQVASTAEQALPALSIALLPSVLVGLILAGIFAATMSTADSQILSCSAAATQDLLPKYKDSFVASKIATLSVAAMALTVALTAGQGVFSLVLSAWAALACAFGPVLIVRLARGTLPPILAFLMVVAGVAVVFWWGESPYAGSIYKLLPGLVAGFAIYGLGRGVLRATGAEAS